MYPRKILLSYITAGHASFLVLGIMAVVFYIQRSTFIDPAWVIFKLALYKELQPEAGRYAATLPQLLPLAGILMELPLKWILLLYSVSFILIYYLIYLIIAYVFRQPVIALAVPLVLVLGIRQSFFWISTETQQTLVYTLLLLGFLNFSLNINRNVPTTILHGFITLLILLLCFFSHPVSLFTTLFVLGFFLLDSGKRGLPLVLPAGIMILILTVVRVRTAPADEYDHGFYQSFLSSIDHLAHLGNSRSFQFIGDHVLTHYLPSAIIFLVTIAFYYMRKLYIKLLYVFLSTALFLLIVFGTFNIWFAEFIQEKNFMPLNIFLLVPFLTDVRFTGARFQIVRPFLILFIFLFPVVQISFKSRQIMARQRYITSLIDETRRFPEKKFIYPVAQIKESVIIATWSVPFETIILSSLPGANSARTLYISGREESPEKEANLSDPDLLLTWPGFPHLIKTTDLNRIYFNPTASGYRTIEK